MLAPPLGVALSRRNFLALSASSVALLAVGSSAAVLSGCASSQPVAKGYAFLHPADLALLAALCPAVLSSALSAEPAARAAQIAHVQKAVDSACLLMGSPAQKQLRQLFDLLTGGLTRRLLAGAPAWETASAADAERFLSRWRNSSIGLFNGGYRGLIKLIELSHFSTPAGYAHMGYPGPLAWVYAAANAP